MESTKLQAIKSVYDFRTCFSDSIVDIQNSVRFEIGNNLGSQSLDSEVNRIFEIYLNIAHSAAIEHESTCKDLDKCLYDALNESESSDADLMLSLALFYALKCGANYEQGRMDLAMKSLIDSNYYLGSYFGFCHFVTGDKAKRSKAVILGRKEHPSKTKEAVIEFTLKHKDQLDKLKSDRKRAEEIAKTVPLSLGRIQNILTELKSITPAK